MVETAFIHSARFDSVSYGDEHPFKVLRYRLTYLLMEELGLLNGPGVRIVECPTIDESQLLTFHRRDYLGRLKEFSSSHGPRADFAYGLGDVENPVFPGLFDWASLVCGGTFEALNQILDGGCRRAFNMAGGWHHAHTARASGFSYLNDAVIAIQHAVKKGLRVAYVDLDAHHGDGVQEAFYTTDRVLTVSIHETGDDFFPHTGFVQELGAGTGKGFSINVPLLRHADDRLFLRALEEVVLPALDAYHPDLLVTQMGVDALRADPLARLELTTDAYEKVARAFAGLDLPWLILGGGGYDKVNVARCWSLIWGVVTGRSVPDRFPPGFCAVLKQHRLAGVLLRDLPHRAMEGDFQRASSALDANLDYLRQQAPLLAAARGRGNREPLR